MNCSYVLHEPSSSVNVRKLAAASVQRNTLESPSPAGSSVQGVADLAGQRPEMILTAHVGLPVLMTEIASRLGVASLVAVDVPGAGLRSHDFFRAPSKVLVPELPAMRTVVAAVIIRPGGSSVELVSTRVLPTDDGVDVILQALEGLIRRHIDQWRPPEPLWESPAEILLPEVLDRA